MKQGASVRVNDGARERVNDNLLYILRQMEIPFLSPKRFVYKPDCSMQRPAAVKNHCMQMRGKAVAQQKKPKVFKIPHLMSTSVQCIQHKHRLP